MDLRHFTKIAAEFAPRDVTAKSLRNFLLQVNTDKKKAASPQLKFDVKVSDSVPKPMLAVTYRDGKSLSWSTAYMTTPEISKDFWRHAKKLLDEEEAKAAQ
ncbi:hypothetical protein DFJ74DRAFT_701200 [Hyaloraphidium curvatum]|nr:hypothetical protein DFJ74DRAFT_701200 [Hyaloraphidium curvatum]